MEVPPALRVLGHEGWTLLVAAGLAVEDAASVLDAAERLRARCPDAPPDERAAALELVTEGRRLAAKLGIEEQLLASIGAAAQATPARVASWHASQLPESARVVEIGCGCGADSIALGHRAQNLIATDIDPVRAACAHTNLMAFGLGSARAIPGDGLAILRDEGRRADVVYADPDRRPGGRRTLDPERWAPPLSTLLALADGARCVFVKAAPALDPTLVPDAFDVTYVSHRGSCLEAFLAHRPGAGGGRVRAVMLPDDGPSIELDGDRSDAPDGPLGAWIYTIDPAAIRARLLAELCARHDLHLVSPGLAFVTGGVTRPTPWLAPYRVLETIALRDKDLRRAVRKRAPRDVRVHARGVAMTAPRIEKVLAGERGRGPVLDVFATRSGERPVAVLALREDRAV